MHTHTHTHTQETQRRLRQTHTHTHTYKYTWYIAHYKHNTHTHTHTDTHTRNKRNMYINVLKCLGFYKRLYWQDIEKAEQLKNQFVIAHLENKFLLQKTDHVSTKSLFEGIPLWILWVFLRSKAEFSMSAKLSFFSLNIV